MSNKQRRMRLTAVSILAGAALSMASPALADEGSSTLQTYSPTHIMKVGVNDAGTEYQGTGLMQLTAEVQVVVDAEVSGKVKSWKTWIRMRQENGSWGNFSNDAATKSYSHPRPGAINTVTSVAVPHLSLAPFAVAQCNVLATSLRAQGLSNDAIFAEDRVIPLAIDTDMSYETSGISDNDLEQANPEFDIDDFFQVYLTCKAKIPDPEKAVAGLDIASFAVHPAGSGNSCPKTYDLKTVFRSGSPETIKFRVRKNGKLSQLYTRTLEKDGQYYQARFDKSYTLDPGQTTFRIEVRDGPKSAVIEKTVTCPPFKVISTFMKYTHGNETYCPKVVTETTTFKTTRPGWVRYQIKLEGGLVAAEGKATSKRVGDSYIATVTRKLPFNQAYDGNLMAEVTNQPGANSGWVKLKVDCLELTSAEIKLTDPRDTSGKHQCPRQGRVKVEMRFNQGGKTVRYKANCSNGFSKVFTAKIRKDRIKGGYRVFGSHKFDVTKTEKVACSLMDMDHGSKVLTWTGREYACATPKGHDRPGAGLAPETPPSTSQTPAAETTPTCTAKWTTECNKVPVRTCKPKTERNCKLQPVSTCTNKVTKTCKPKRKQVCKKVRGNNVCKVKVTRDCTRNVKKVCTRKMVNKCKSVTKNACSLELQNKCERKKVVTCKR